MDKDGMREQRPPKSGGEEKPTWISKNAAGNTETSAFDLGSSATVLPPCVMREFGSEKRCCSTTSSDSARHRALEIGVLAQMNPKDLSEREPGNV